MFLKFGITGSTGSLGRILTKANNKIKYTYFKGDVTNKKEVFKWLKNKKLDAIIHLAAVVPIKIVNTDIKRAYKVNYLGTKNIIDAIKKENVSWFFFASTSHVYKSKKIKIDENSLIKPISYYGKTKYLAEQYIVKVLKKKKINYCIGRIFSTTNKNQKKNYLVPDLKNKIKKTKKKIVLENLNHYRDFISMNDISKIIISLYKSNFIGIINIGSGVKIHLKNIAELICKKYNKKFEFIDNKKKTYLVANVTKLKKIYKKKFITKIDELIF